jgi:hypothetical protein
MEKEVMADGSCIVMENWTADKNAKGLTAMYKGNGYKSRWWRLVLGKKNDHKN